MGKNLPQHPADAFVFENEITMSHKRDALRSAWPQPVHSDFTEGNEGNEGPGSQLRLFVSFVEFRDLNLWETARRRGTQENSVFRYSSTKDTKSGKGGVAREWRE
jgi:hypothetical protein